MIQKIDFHDVLILLIHRYGTILHNALKKIKSALPIGMLLKDTRVFQNIQEIATPSLS